MDSAKKTDANQVKQRYFPWLIVIGCCFLQVGGIGTFIDACGVFYVPASSALGITVGDYSLYITFLFVGTVPSALCLGYLVERIDVRILIGVNVVICAVVLMFMGYYPYMWMRYIAGFVFGFCGGMFFMTMTPILINNWFKKRKGLAMGIAMASSGIGAAILSPAITALIGVIGWQLAYVCVGIFVMVVILPWDFLVFRLKPVDRGLKPFGWQEGDDEKEALNAQMLKPGIPAKYSIKTISFVCACCFVGCISIFAGYNSHLNAFGQTLGYSAMISSTFLTFVSVGSIADKFIMGVLYDYMSIYKIIWINCILLGLGLLILATQTELWLLYLGCALFGIENSLVAVQCPLLIRDLFGDRDYSKLYAYTRVGVGVFGLMGPMMVVAILNTMGSYRPVWVMSIFIVVAAVVFVIVVRRNKNKYMVYWHEAGPRKDDEL